MMFLRRVWFYRTFLILLLLGSPLCSPLAMSDDALIGDLLQKIERLERRLSDLETNARRQDVLEQDLQQLMTHNQSKRSQVEQKRSKKHALYGSLRPTLEYKRQTGNTLDVGDATSFVGLRSSLAINEGLNAFLQAEWRVKISSDGELGDGRKAFVGLEGDWGRVALGKQRPPQYTLIAESVDIFNSFGSPFGYDPLGPFFTDNLVSYEYKAGDFSVLTAAKFDGEAGEDKEDLINVGVAYDSAGRHLAITYLDTTGRDGADALQPGVETDTWALSYADHFGELYAALAYQDVNVAMAGADDFSGSSLDVALAYPLAEGYKLKAGYFTYDDGIESATSNAFWGYNLTLEWQLHDDIRTHIEYLDKKVDNSDDLSLWVVGIRYDFDHKF